LRIALKSTADANLAGDSVCCGRFGRAAILRLAQQLGWRVEAGDEAARLERQALFERRARGFFSFFEVLGLFNGLFGVGLALLDSVASPGQHPSLSNLRDSSRLSFNRTGDSHNQTRL
jgi:lantibiotic modifying enzyme